jgi:signal transduction histidine kinase
LQITIEDNGIGIPLNKQKIIFQKNKQSREEDSKKGNGIGLFICSEIIKSYDGTIEVDPNTKIGTKFIITMNDIL